MAREPDRDDVASAIEATNRFRLLRALPASSVCAPASGAEQIFRAAVIDCETTGVDTEYDEIIELASTVFEYGAQSGHIIRVVDDFQALQEPSRPIDDKVARLTGLTNEMLKGQKIDPARLAAHLEGVNLCIAHNAAFDRRMIERTFPALAGRPWACSMREIDWSAYGAPGQRLGDIVTMHGLFTSAHRAAADVRALLHVLSLPLPATNATAFEKLLASARTPSAVIVAIAAPAHMSSALKRRGYRWSPAVPKAWWRETPTNEALAELTYLRDEIYKTVQRQPEIAIVTAADRYRPLREISAQFVPASSVMDAPSKNFFSGRVSESATTDRSGSCGPKSPGRR